MITGCFKTESTVVESTIFPVESKRNQLWLKQPISGSRPVVFQPAFFWLILVESSRIQQLHLFRREHKQRSGARVNMNDFEAVLREQIIQEWRSLDNLTPQEAHSSSRPCQRRTPEHGRPGEFPGYSFGLASTLSGGWGFEPLRCPRRCKQWTHFLPSFLVR